jgi:regulator of sigma E protease
VNTVLAFLFVLGVLIFVHELGHYMMAKRLGVRVLTFSLGFGPKILKFRRGDTEYCISAIPLGGYVKMAGENPEDPRSGNPDEFLSKTKWERFQILIMGPAMNIILAVVVMALVMMQGAEVPAFQDQPPVIGAVLPASPAEKVGIRRGDRILTVAGDEVDTWDRFYMAIGTRPGRDVAVTLLRDGKTTAVTVHPNTQTRFEVGDIGVLPDVNPGIRTVTAGDPAEKAGLKPGDVVVAVNGERVIFARQLAEAISRNAGHEIDLTIRREGQERHVAVTPIARDGKGVIGISIAEATRSFEPGVLEAIGLSVKRNVAASAHGAGRNRAAVGRIGSRGLDRALHADGLDQPESRAAEPASHPRARRRAHLHHAARGDRAARLQHGGQGEDVPGGVRPPDDVDGDGHLQRPHED